jgi:hypothetical protein
MTDRPHCLPGCDRLDGHDGRDFGVCMRDGHALCRYCGGPLSTGSHYREHGRMYENGPVEDKSCGGPLDLTHRHPDIPVNVPVRKRYTIEDAAEAMLAAALAPRYSPYFGTRPPPPPLPSRCYQCEYGFTVHIRGACRCKDGKPPCPFCGGHLGDGREHWRVRGRMRDGGPYVNQSCGSVG